MHRLTLLATCLLLSAQCAAHLTIPGLTTQGLGALALTDKTLARTGLLVNEDDLVATNKVAPLTEKQLHEAKVWGLSEEEETRFTQLMQNRSGLYYKGLNLSPVDILGLNARNDSERNHLAELAATQEAQKAGKNIAWTNAFYKAYNELFKNVPVVGEDFDPALYAPAAYKPVILNANDNLYLFIKGDEALQTILLSLIEAINTTASAHLHLLFLSTDDVDVQRFANQHQIPKQLVLSGQITLNHGDLQFDGLKLKKKTTPLLLLARAGHSRVVDLGAF
ncbi:MAG: TIGR03759 family integrating conjugative element protein [Tatlockia sp.]|nr:TIGR03759 family integrating conjugative element protein [Tatlockia sp.]